MTRAGSRYYLPLRLVQEYSDLKDNSDVCYEKGVGGGKEEGGGGDRRTGVNQSMVRTRD